MALRTRTFGALDLLTLHLFVVVCEERSLNRAAAREHIALSALSRRISDLEATLRLTLLRRHSRGVEPTATGLMVLQHAQLILRDVGQMETDLAERAGGVRGTVRLFANTWAISEYIPKQLSSFLSTHSTIAVEIEETISADTMRAVRERAADMGIISSDMGGEGLRLLPYARDHLVAVMAPGHPLAGRDGPVRLAELEPHDVIGASRGSALERLMLAGAAEAAMVLRIRVRASGFDTLYQMIGAGLGVGLGPSLTAARYGTSLGLVTRPLAERWAHRQLSLCLPVGRLPPHVELLAEHLRMRA